MIAQAGAVLARIADRLPLSAGRAQRRRWAGNGRAHIEVKGAHLPGNEAFATRLEGELARLDGSTGLRSMPFSGG